MTAGELLRRYAAGERDFRQASLEGADLSHAHLEQVCLAGADLYGANLEGACLAGVDSLYRRIEQLVQKYDELRRIS